MPNQPAMRNNWTRNSWFSRVHLGFPAPTPQPPPPSGTRSTSHPVLPGEPVLPSVLLQTSQQPDMMRLILLVACCALAAVEGYKSGAPPEVCADMTPQHGVDPQPQNSFPYQLQVSRDSIKAGESTQVTITGKKGETFKGFLIEARVGETPIGHFSTGSDAKTIDCAPGKHNAATHADPKEKKSVRVTWTAPKNLQERVTFYVTVAKNGGEYWVKIPTRNVNVQ